MALMVDATDDTDPAVETTLSAFNVQGLPAVILFDSTGKEVRRFTQFVDPENFLEALERVN